LRRSGRAVTAGHGESSHALDTRRIDVGGGLAWPGGEGATTVTHALLFAVAALVVGYSKTSIGGLATISVAIFASLMPARESTAALLLILIVGDLVAVWHYRHDCDWALLRRLIPAVLPGLLLGALFLAVVDDTVLRRSIGAMLLALAGIQLWLRTRGEATGAAVRSRAHSRTASLVAGLAAGFTTMTANAAGGVMTLYFTAQGVRKMRFLGTGACLFLGVNLCKLPLSAALGLFTGDALRRTVLLAPLVLLGAWAGLHTARRLSQTRFDVAVLAATALSALALLVR
jgi:uncharacterized protein